jgi:hypothetical protein
MPADDLVPSLLATSDVLGTGWYGAAADAGPGKTVAVVGDGALGLLGVLAARQLGADRIIAMSRHERRHTEGEGRVQSRGEPIIPIRPGDVVSISAGEWHSHGAAPGHSMTHLSLTEATPSGPSMSPTPNTTAASTRPPPRQQQARNNRNDRRPAELRAAADR